MVRNREDIVAALLADPQRLLEKKPFVRGSHTWEPTDCNDGVQVKIGQRQVAALPSVDYHAVSQERFLKELDPLSHEVMFDENIPSICVKLNGGSFSELKFKRMPIPLQKRILEKRTLSLCGNPRQFTLVDKRPDDREKANFARFKQAWANRNQDGRTTRAVYEQGSVGDVGLLYYHDAAGRVRSRVLSFADGYVLIPHNDDNGDRVLESVYYRDSDGVERLDSYDDRYFYRMSRETGEWVMEQPVPHGFSEIPLATKRGTVAWNEVQSLIEAYEILYNIYIVVQKRHGWGILYVKGKIKDEAKRIAGSIILNDVSIDGKGSAEFKTPPSPEGVLDTLQSIYEQIQIGASVTFLLPRDIKAQGDVSGLAVMLTQSLDLEGANKAVIDWQDFLNKCVRLFKEGLARELVNTGENPNAVTEFRDMEIMARFKVWRPFNEVEFNQMLCTLKSAGVISAETATERSTMSEADEAMRLERQNEGEAEKATNALYVETQPQVQEQLMEESGSADSDGSGNDTEG